MSIVFGVFSNKHNIKNDDFPTSSPSLRTLRCRTGDERLGCTPSAPSRTARCSARTTSTSPTPPCLASSASPTRHTAAQSASPSLLSAPSALSARFAGLRRRRGKPASDFRTQCTRREPRSPGESALHSPTHCHSPPRRNPTSPPRRADAQCSARCSRRDTGRTRERSARERSKTLATAHLSLSKRHGTELRSLRPLRGSKSKTSSSAPPLSAARLDSSRSKNVSFPSRTNPR